MARVRNLDQTMILELCATPETFRNHEPCSSPRLIFGCCVSTCSVLARNHFQWTAANEEESELSCSYRIFLWRCFAIIGYNAKKGHEVDQKSLILEPVAAIKDAYQATSGLAFQKKSVCMSKGGFFCLANLRS
jgi:hypothetical protein